MLLIPKKIILPIILLTTLVALLVWSIVYTKPAYHGRVIDAETGEPIEGAVIEAEYYKANPGLPEVIYSAVDVKETVTDKEGYFSIPRLITLTAPYIWRHCTFFLIYKPGYLPFPEHPSATPLLSCPDLEMFLSSAIGTEKTLEAYNEDTNKLEPTKMKMGIIKLAKLKTKEEREHFYSSAHPARDASFYRKQPILIRLLREEYQYLYGIYPNELYR